MDLAVPAQAPFPRTEDHRPGWQLAVASAILGWILDAFDFFVLVFLFNELMARFQVGKAAIVWSLSLTLALRPIGALLFGGWADRSGRKKPLIACVLFFSSMTLLSGYAPSYPVFLALRGLYGIGMGGYWGIGASYAMENAPVRSRGFLSGMMQSGYSIGYLLAAIGIQTIVPAFGWRAMFVVGSIVAVAIVLITWKAPESRVFAAHPSRSVRDIAKTLLQHRGMFVYLLLLMTALNCLAHGSQDLYPDFLRGLPWMSGAKLLGMRAMYGIPVLYNIGAITGALLFGNLSEKIGRRSAVMLSLTLCLIAIPAWAFGWTLLALALGSFFMQMGVQGAYGVIPAHLNELSPPAVRSLLPGFVYQMGVLLSSPFIPILNLLQRRLGYSWALTSFELCMIGVLMLIFGFGPEERGRDFNAA
ncbi:MAG TPA: MFS transporter [Acidobacteriaceae bacterium]|nr:MFS transporter [Acidobacteriaceae bacterium]